MIARLALVALGTLTLTGCFTCGYPVDGLDDGYEADQWSIDGDGVVVTDDAEQVWVGLGPGSLCGMGLASGYAQDDRYLDDMEPTVVFDVEPGRILVSTDDLGVLGPDGSVAPVAVDGVVVDAEFHGDEVAVLYDDCRVQVGDDMVELEGDACDGHLVEADGTLAVVTRSALHRLDGDGVEMDKVDGAAWSEALGAWLLLRDDVIQVEADGKVLLEVDTLDAVEVFAMGKWVGFRDAEGHLARVDIDGAWQEGPWIGVGGRIHSTIDEDRLVLERDGAHVRLWDLQREM